MHTLLIHNTQNAQRGERGLTAMEEACGTPTKAPEEATEAPEDVGR